MKFCCQFGWKPVKMPNLVSDNDAEEESEDEDYVPSDDWKKVNILFFINV